MAKRSFGAEKRKKELKRKKKQEEKRQRRLEKKNPLAETNDRESQKQDTDIMIDNNTGKN
ncbi:MAG: hypothetical protein JXB88_10455 [Spirochaetales bacterium]|nr:hypothetical protein [Spirochaetales bacterium]